MRIKKRSFAQGVESLVDPISVGSLHFMQSFNRLLPKSIQRKLVRSSAKTIPYMGFVVEPYSAFLCYEIADLERARSMLPEGFEPVKTKVFDHDEPKYYAVIGCFRAHTSAFWGLRAEFYIIAKDKRTGLLSWIIIEYDTNTISFDNKNGLTGPNSTQSTITINHRGLLSVDVHRDDNARRLAFTINVEDGQMAPLDQRLWLEGNLSIGYGENLSDTGADIFSLRFEPLEVEKALHIPSAALKLEKNTWFPGLLHDQPAQVVCFPYAQHFVSDSPGHSSNLKNRTELVAASQSIKFNQIAVFSAKPFFRMFLLGSATSFIVTIGLIILLILK